MKSEVISFFYDFNCIADKCSDNCCRSWNLTVDEETVSKYKAEPGEEGRKLRYSIKKTSDGGYCLRAPFGKCIHQDKCGLCKLQSGGNSEHLPKVCRLFPRYTVSYGGYDVGVIDLACEEAAKLFLKQKGRLSFIESREPLEIYWSIPEADFDFAKTLREDLEIILDRIWDESRGDLWEIQKDCFAHIYKEHLKLVKNEFADPDKTDFDRGKLLEEHYGELTWLMQERYKDIYDGLPFIPISFVNKVIYTEFSDWYLVFYHPRSFKLLWLYKKYFGKLLESEADKIFTDKLKELYKKYDWLEEKLKSYFSYKLQMFYMGASLDYYLIEPMSLAVFCTEFLVLLVITHTEKQGNEFNVNVFAKILSENERLISHNVSFRERVMKRMREELF